MHRSRGTTGSIEATVRQKARVHALTEAALVQELTSQPEPDPLTVAEAIERHVLAFSPEQGWHVVSPPHH